MLIDLQAQATQAQLAMVVGVSQQAISAMMGEGKLPPEGLLGDLLVAYCQRLRDQAAGRLGEGMGLDLVQERAALAREQRILRVKGHVAVAGKPMRLLVQAVGARVRHQYDRPWGDAPRRSQLVVIAEHDDIDPALIRQVLGA